MTFMFYRTRDTLTSALNILSGKCINVFFFLLFSPFVLLKLGQFFGDIELYNAGTHFVGDVVTAHAGENYIYSGKFSSVLFSPSFLTLLRDTYIYMCGAKMLTQRGS